MAAQGVLGYVQYYEEIPALLVGFHVFGAVLVFICVQQLLLELRVPLAVDPIHVRQAGLLETRGAESTSPQGDPWSCTVTPS
jgi:hypothetical protein